mmetsp:Transcript_4537/g.6354  ORF Transcript_4537/g.6354 Transcript_4537/m.6354 type:complete len:170 (-) Transcript_4537:222-731(-)|eukprot:CAMPEP_0194764396 /NCGR_PEP_ID=MMETSP0323_2-20130528/22612_1 /TAXON_ID=2866 ORGANISM="Crypthecodinium cohnii, Strain Seligo" /NCGR_SAMPLE_ID=MMETSP0323_2 /ASSEMBLY_ACC=CAM_ASM_000346 /LENGTH=169 /DNA_ID=CAMNT_0039691451 /DNA_START=117 /DNA_END=626 /DNA_ORIENTATION=+
MAQGGPGPSGGPAFDRSGPLGAPVPSLPQARDPFRLLNVEERAFLEDFGRTISVVFLGGAVLGGSVGYGLARFQGWRRVKTTAFLTGFLTPMIGWTVLLNKNKDQYMGIIQKVQMADMEDHARRQDTSATSGVEAVGKLFPPPPTFSAGTFGQGPGPQDPFAGQGFKKW